MALDGTETRNLMAAATGLIEGALGSSALTAVALGVGVVLQVVEKDHPGLRSAEHITEGVVDASAAILAYDIMLGLSPGGARASHVRGTAVRGMAAGWREPLTAGAP